jgi:hypothetical protein
MKEDVRYCALIASSPCLHAGLYATRAFACPDAFFAN